MVDTPAYDEEELEQQYQVFAKMLDGATPVEARNQLRLLRVDEELIQSILDRHESRVLVIRDLDEPRSVYAANRFTWYTGPRPGDKNWPALEAGLVARGWSTPALESLDAASTKIVALLNHPKSESFRAYGLVVGYVQSGKTTNFTAVMAKAADRGYKLIIVLSGIHNALRRQTQVRLMQDLVDHNLHKWHTVTSPEYDFRPPPNAAAFFAARDQHVLLVVKKNAAVLRKLRTWLRSANAYLENCPTLIIDDEADQSTVATKVINPLLRGVVDSFPKVVYIGYTATPFANLLINPSEKEDFYPRDFIVNLPEPHKYFGPESLFGRDLGPDEDPEDADGGLDMVRLVREDEVADLRPVSASEASSFKPAMTRSLREAFLYFLMATAARRARGQTDQHSTMLVHTSVQTDVHEAFKLLIRHERGVLQRALQVGDEALIERLEKLWVREAAAVDAEAMGEQPVSFDDVLAGLPSVVDALRPVADNYRSRDRLDYTGPPVVAVAIGGNTLSRGLTLEGLVVSLFVRSVSAYDTLLQMGRWFGYRTGYSDLPRIWLTEELADWFRHLATVEHEMRRDIDRYMVEDVTPETFAVRLRNHPKLAITAAAKMRDAVVSQAAYGGLLVETRYFKVAPGPRDAPERGLESSADVAAWLSQNESAGRALFESALELGRTDVDVTNRSRRLVRDVPVGEVLSFMSAYRFHPKSQDMNAGRLKEYVRRRNAEGALNQWNVALIGSERADATTWSAPGEPLPMVRRARVDGPSGPVADIKTLTSRRDELIDLQVGDDPPRTALAARGLRSAQLPTHGLVLLYPIDPVSRTDKTNRFPLKAPAACVMAVAFVFPKPVGEDSAVEYVYYSADLSGLYIEEDDPEALEQDDDA